MPDARIATGLSGLTLVTAVLLVTQLAAYFPGPIV